MAKNIALMEHVYGLIEASTIQARDDGRYWVQGSWGSDMSGLSRTELLGELDGLPIGATCKTAGCFAGWTLLESGYYFEYSAYRRAPDGKWVVPELEAARLLGLTEEEAEELFRGYNSLEAIHALIKGWAEETDAAAV